MVSLAAWLVVAAAAAEAAPLESQVPAWAQARWQAMAARQGLELSARIAPVFLTGDFDGDGTADLALLVERTADKKVGIVVLHRGTDAAYVLGAGKELGNGGDDFEWIDVWSVEPRPGQSPTRPKKGAAALLLEKRESSSALVYFEGGRYRWQQRGD